MVEMLGGEEGLGLVFPCSALRDSQVWVLREQCGTESSRWRQDPPTCRTPGNRNGAVS